MNNTNKQKESYSVRADLSSIFIVDSNWRTIYRTEKYKKKVTFKI